MILLGMWKLARGRKSGLAEFENSDDALLSSLAPLIAFPLVGAVVTGLHGDPVLAILAFASRLCAVLAVPLITYEFARVTKHEAAWRRTCAALDWSFWLILPALLVAAFFGAGLVEAGLGQHGAEAAAMALIVAYMLWLNWFTVRAGLQLNWWQAVLLVLLNNAAIALLSAVPVLLTGATF